jgi:hypothetical protein
MHSRTRIAAVDLLRSGDTVCVGMQESPPEIRLISHLGAAVRIVLVYLLQNDDVWILRHDFLAQLRERHRPAGSSRGDVIGDNLDQLARRGRSWEQNRNKNTAH